MLPLVSRSSPIARWWLAAVPLAFLAVVLVAPALRLLAEGWGAESWWAPWQDDYLRGRLLWSFAQASITCVATLLLGLPMAWVLARWEFPGRSILLRGLMLPFVVPRWWPPWECYR